MIDLKKLESGLIEIANNHNAEYINRLFDWEEKNADSPFFAIMICNVPTLADIRFLCEELGLNRDYVSSNELWGFIRIGVPKRP